MESEDTNLPASPTPPAPIVRVDTYENTVGHRLIERVPVGDVPDGFVRFVGFGSLTVQTERGPVGDPFQFAIHADTIERAFALFEASAQAAGRARIAELQSAMRRNALMTPPTAAESAILDANGRPL